MAKDPMGDGGIALSWVAEARVVRRQRMEASTTVQTLLMFWVTTAREMSHQGMYRLLSRGQQQLGGPLPSSPRTRGRP